MITATKPIRKVPRSDGVVYTILLQRIELALQRKELELTREQLTRSAKAQELLEEAPREQGKTLQLTAKLNALSAGG